MTNQPSIDTAGRGVRLVLGWLALLAALVVLGYGDAPLDGGSGSSRALSVVLPPIAMGLAAAALCLPSRWAATLALLGGGLAGIGRGVVYDPLRDRPCVRCLSSPFATHPDAQLADLAAFVGGLLILMSLTLAVARHRRVWSGIGLVIVGFSTTAYDTPHGIRSGAVRALVAVAALSLAATVVRLAIARRSMTRLAGALSSGRSSHDVLTTHLRDPGAWVEFAAPLPDGTLGWVLDDGSPAGHTTAGHTTTGHTTMVNSRGRPVARIHHNRPLATISPELVLRLEQAGLEAGLAAQAAELASSRTRIVARADAERRQLERDIHDGAQQYLLALAVDLSLAAGDPVQGSAEAEAALLDSRRDAEAALEELRRIARGVYPVLLDSGGLAPALQELSRRVGTRITVDGPGVADVPPVAAAALYGLVEELATSNPAVVKVTVGGSRPQVVDISGGNVDAASLNLERVAASGGKVEHMSGRIGVTFP